MICLNAVNCLFILKFVIMPPFPKPTFEYVVNVKKEVKHIKKYRDNKPGRAIPKSSTTNLLIATWNIANFGVQKREGEHYKIIELGICIIY